MQRSESTFSWQHALPHQPVPSLAHTLRLLLETLRPLAHAPHELARCRRLADELLAPLRVGAGAGKVACPAR